jgi:hypothetical protein
MKRSRWLILIAGLGVALLSGSIGATGASLVDLETSNSNGFQAWSSSQWLQTTQADFAAGVLNQVDTTSSPGNVVLASGVGGNWYNISWTYRRAINIDHTKVTNVATPSSTYASFPVLVYATGLSNINANGTDIRFTASDGTTELPREIESYSGGTLYAWVKLTLTKDAGDSSNDMVYMYYGNSSATEPAAASTYGSRNVWNSDYKGVWHLKETSGTVADSTSNANNGAASGVNMNATGKIDGGDDFDGSNDYVSITSSSSLQITSAMTISAWIKGDTFSNSDPTYVNAILRKGEDNPYNYQLAVNMRQVSMFLDGYDGSGIHGNTVLNTGTWYYATGTWNGSTVTIYLNGASDGTGSKTGAIGTDSRALYLGGRTGATDIFDGVLDEVRISNSARSAQWVQTEYNNQNSPSSFCLVGGEEHLALYLSSGTLASQVLDTGTAGARWDGLFWARTLPAGTGVTFEVRANNTIFARGDASPGWLYFGPTSPVTVGLPAGEYMQWRATLTTSDVSVTPSLAEVAVYHY